MKRGEIWLVSLDPTSGHEQRGRRPVLIVSPEAFNQVTKVPIVLPITSGGNFARTAGFAVPLTGAGAKTTGVVRCDQPRALALAARRGRKLESIPVAVMDEVLARISHRVCVSQMSCRAEPVFELVLDRTRLASSRGLPVKRQDAPAVALIRRGEAFSGRLAQRVPCAAWNRGRKSST